MNKSLLLLIISLMSAGVFLFVKPERAEAAIAFRSATTTNNTTSCNTQSVTVNVPAGTTNGDVMVVGVQYGGSTQMTTPAGWTLINHVNNSFSTTQNLTTFYRVASSEPASYTWTMPSLVCWITAAGSYSGVDNSTPINAQTTVGVTTGTSLVANAVTTTMANDTIVTIFAGYNGTSTTWTPPAGQTERVDSNNTSVRSIELNDSNQASVGSSGTFTATASVSNYGANATIALKTANTVPTISVQPSSSYGSYTRTGPGNTTFNVNFTAADGEQTGAGALSYSIKRSSDNAIIGGGAGTFTSGVAQSISLAYNATNLSAGSNTLYVAVSDGTFTTNTSTFTVLRDDVLPTSATNISTGSGTLTTNSYAVTFTPNDATSTNSNEIRYQIRTLGGGGGTLLTSGTSTNATSKTTSSFTDSTLTAGANSRYVRTCDGANNCFDTQFPVYFNPAPSSVGTAANGTPQSYYLTLNGSANPYGVLTYGHFRVFTANPGNCSSDTGGTRYPEGTENFPDLNLGSGTTLITDVTSPAFTYTIPLNASTFLNPNTTYWYCAYAVNSNGASGASSVVSFTTPDGPVSPCDPPTSGNLSIPAGAVCNFVGTVGGVDAGTGTRNTAQLTIPSGTRVSISAGQKIAFGSVSLARGAILSIARGGSLSGGGVYVHDNDRDNYLDDATQYVGSTPSAATEFVRRNLISSAFNYSWKIASSGASFDCNPSNTNVNQNVASLVADADNDGYKTSAAAATQCVGVPTTVSGRTYWKDTSGNYTWLNDAQKLSASTDCQDNPNGAPCAPTTVNASNPSSQTQNSVTWSGTATGGSVPAGTGFDLKWCTGNSCTPNSSAVLDVTSPYTHNFTANPSTIYRYAIAAKNGVGTGTYSTSIGQTTTAAACTNTTVYSDNDLDGYGNDGTYSVGLTTRASQSSGANLVINKPGDIQNGMFMMAVVEWSDSGGTRTITAPAGWNLIDSVINANQNRMSMWYKYASGEGASYTWTLSSSTGSSQGFITSFSNIATSSPVRATASGIDNSYYIITYPQLNYTAGDLMVYVGGVLQGSSSNMYATFPARGDEILNKELINYWSNDGLVGVYRTYNVTITSASQVTFQGAPGTGGVLSVSLKPLTASSQVQCLTGAPSSGWSTNNSDCDDTTSVYYQSNSSGYPDFDADGVNPSFNASSCSGASLRTGVSASSGTDCDPYTGWKWQNINGYADADNDTYTTGGVVAVCSGSSLASGYRSSASGTADCYDANANVKPGQTGYFSTPTGSGTGGGYDYDCDGSSTKQSQDLCNAYYYSGYVLSGGCTPGGSLLMCGTHQVTTPSGNCGDELPSNRGTYIGTGVYWKDAACFNDPESQVGAGWINCR